MSKLSWFFPLGTENLGEAEIGGKAYFLGRMLQHDLPVPRGFVLLRTPESESEWLEVLQGWKQLGSPKLAIRSSALGEDSEALSFAGQNLSFLGVDDTTLRKAVQDCFDSVKREASLAYRKHFSQKSESSSEEHAPKMAVVLQAMVNPEFSGVFFSRDPRSRTAGWLLEVIRGLGEELVSGHQTPSRFCEEVRGVPHIDEPGSDEADLHTDLWTQRDTDQIVLLGKKVKEFVKFDLDMEWVKDQDGVFWIVQARPITSLERTTELSSEISREIKRLTLIHSSKTVWDCQTFSEWTGTPTPLTFSIWQHAFSSSGSFGKALSRLGYLGCANQDFQAKAGVLEQVFGHAYINLSYLSELYFGSILAIDSAKGHVGFSTEKLNFRSLLHLPEMVLRMLTVAWRLQTSRAELILQCREKLKEVQDLRLKVSEPFEWNDPAKYRGIDRDSLSTLLFDRARYFSEDLLEHSFLLIISAEATLQNLQGALTKIQGASKADGSLKHGLGTQLNTLSLEMERQYAEACQKPEKQKAFLHSFGHRGPGELELSSPRWAEMGARAFPQPALPAAAADFAASPENKLDDLKLLPGVYGTLVRQEWALLLPMLELRETWKDELLRTYGEIRGVCLELGKRLELGTGIFWLRLHEVKKLLAAEPSRAVPIALRLIEKRKKRSQVLSRISLPSSFSLAQLEDLIFAKNASSEKMFQGEGLSPGVAYGEVRIVTDPEATDVSSWPDDVVLVAEATDPGWTPLFLKAKAIVVEKGGVLSHCAIVAREMGLPVVSGIFGCHLKFKEGEHVWVDGSAGSIRKA